MSNSPLRVVEFSAGALVENLRDIALSEGEDCVVDVRLDAYGHGSDWVRGIAEPLGFLRFLTDDESSHPISSATRRIYGVTGGRPVATVRGEVVAMKNIVAGDSVSYGYTWTATRDTQLALVSLGFADGLPRRGSNRVHATVAETSRPQVGRIAMDQLVIDITDVPTAVGDTVTFWDHQSPLSEWVEAFGGEPLSLVSRLGIRVERRWLT